MKRYLQFIYILLIPFAIACFYSCDKDEISSKQAESFVKYYGGGFLDEGIKVLSLDNGGSLIMGNVETPDNGKQVCVIFTDEYGNSKDSVHLYGRRYDDYGNAIKKTNEGYVIVGSTEMTSKGGSRDILLIRISANGTLIDSLVTISDPKGDANEIGNDILVNDDQSLVITGYRNSELERQNLILVITNAQGILEDSSKFYKKFEGYAGNAISKMSVPNMYLIAGYQTIISSTETTKEVFVIGWNGGSPLSLPKSSNNDNAYAVSIMQTSDNDFLIPCNITQEDKKSFKVLMVSVINLQPTLIWEKYYGENDLDIVKSGFVSDNKIYLTGTSGELTETSDEESFGNVLLFEMNSDGSSPQYHYFGDGVSFRGNSFDFTRDNGIIITGANKINENSMITLIKLKSDYSL